MLHPWTQGELCRIRDLGPWRDVEYVPGKPTVAPRPGAPLFVCRTLRKARGWARTYGGEVWRCEANPGPARSVLRDVWRWMRLIGWGNETPMLVNEVTLIERVEGVRP